MGLVTVDMIIPHKRVRMGNSSVCIYLVVSSLTLLWCNNLHWVHFLCFSVQKGSSVYLPSGWINFQPFSRITFQGVSLERNRGGKNHIYHSKLGSNSDKANTSLLILCKKLDYSCTQRESSWKSWSATVLQPTRRHRQKRGQNHAE